MLLSFRTILLGVVVLGLGMGAAFGIGVAYGRGDPKTVESGLTQQQIQSLLGISGSGAGGTAQGGTQGPSGGTGAAGAAASGRNPTGRITAVDGRTLTIETRAGAQKVNLSPSTKINKLTTGTTADLTANATIVASGTRNADGSFDATEVSQIPAELQALLGGTGTAGGTQTTPGGGSGGTGR